MEKRGNEKKRKEEKEGKKKKKENILSDSKTAKRQRIKWIRFYGLQFC